MRIEVELVHVKLLCNSDLDLAVITKSKRPLYFVEHAVTMRANLQKYLSLT